MDYIDPINLRALLDGTDDTEWLPQTQKMRAVAQRHDARVAKAKRAKRAALATRAATLARASFDALTSERHLFAADRFAALLGLAWHQRVPMEPARAGLSLGWYALGTFLR